MYSISRSSLILEDCEDDHSPTRKQLFCSPTQFLTPDFKRNSGKHSKLQLERSPYYTRSMARRIATSCSSDSCVSPTSRDISLTSLSFNQVNVNRHSLAPHISFTPPSSSIDFIRRPVLNNLDLSFSNFNNLDRRNSSGRRRNANVGNVDLGCSCVSPFRPPNGGMDISGRGCGNWINCCKLLGIVALIVAFLMLTVWCIHGHFNTTRIVFNEVEKNLYKLQQKMERMKHHVEMGTNKQLQTIEEDTIQKLADVEQMLREIKTCTQSNSPSSVESNCCSTFNSGGGDGGSGRPDFALESSGGSILGTDGTEQFESRASTSIFGIPICCSRNGPRAVIQANIQPGECWAFKGSSGSVTIKLIDYVSLSGVTLEHIPKSISPSGDIDSAPKEFSIVGLANGADIQGTEYGPFHYNRNGPPAQFFEIDGCGQSYEIIRLQIHSNHGNPRFTCVYRLQVHGKLNENGL